VTESGKYKVRCREYCGGGEIDEWPGILRESGPKGLAMRVEIREEQYKGKGKISAGSIRPPADSKEIGIPELEPIQKSNNVERRRTIKVAARGGRLFACVRCVGDKGGGKREQTRGPTRKNARHREKTHYKTKTARHDTGKKRGGSKLDYDTKRCGNLGPEKKSQAKERGKKSGEEKKTWGKKWEEFG